MKRIRIFTIMFLCFGMMCSFDVTCAHHGGSGSYGGHYDYHHKESTRYYCGGHSAHLHPDGVCPYSSTDKKSSSCYSHSTVRRVQKKLNQLGYHCGRADGSCGAKTRKAIKSFQRKKGLKVNGKINKTLLKKLKIKK